MPDNLTLPPEPAGDEHVLLDTHEAAAFLRVGYTTLRSYRCAGLGPSFVRVGARLIRYRLSDLKAYVRDVQPRGRGISRPDVREKAGR